MQAPPLSIQEKVRPKAWIDDLLRRTREGEKMPAGAMGDLCAGLNGIPERADKTEFYPHDQNWSNRLILGDSLQLVASLAEREGLRGEGRRISFDPAYGIKCNRQYPPRPCLSHSPCSHAVFRDPAPSHDVDNGMPPNGRRPEV